MMRCRTLLTVTMIVGAALLGFSRVAVSEEPQEQISDGTAIQIEKIGISITPPKDWEILRDRASLSLVMQEQSPKKIEYDKAIFQRNITVAAVHKPTPIDDARAIALKKDLEVNFAKNPMASEFNFLEHKFFDFKGKNDGLLAYSTFKLGEFNMMQMHVLVSGSEKQFLLTYTDLADRFSNPETFNAAWASIVSIEVKGAPPVRYQEGVLTCAVILFLLGLFQTIRSIHYRRATNSYIADSDIVYADSDVNESEDFDDPITRSGVWALGSKAPATIPRHQPKTAQKAESSPKPDSAISFMSTWA